MDHNPNEICYLCSSRLGNDAINHDHIFQQQFVTRDQPKAQGFNYGGVLPINLACNKKFGTGNQAPEAICGKAMRLLDALHRDDALKVRSDNPNFRIAAINSSWFKDFTQQDINFFKLIDVTDLEYEDWAHGTYLSDEQMINPFIIPTNIALTTLAKRPAGFLVKRHGYKLSSRWRILSLPFYVHDQDFNLDSIFGDVKPLEVGIKLWLKSEGNGWFAGYRHNCFFVLFCIEPTASNLFQQIVYQLKSIMSDFSCMFFD